MKKRLLNFGKITMLLFSVMFLFNGCADKNYYLDDNKDIYVRFFTIDANQWRWNESRGRYEASAVLTNFTSDMFNNGAAASATVFVQEDGFEVQKMLPYVDVWQDNLGNVFTEYISLDYSFGNTSTVYFYVQASDLGRDDFSARTLEFKFSFEYYK